MILTNILASSIFIIIILIIVIGFILYANNKESLIRYGNLFFSQNVPDNYYKSNYITPYIQKTQLNSLPTNQDWATNDFNIPVYKFLMRLVFISYRNFRRDYISIQKDLNMVKSFPIFYSNDMPLIWYYITSCNKHIIIIRGTYFTEELEKDLKIRQIPHFIDNSVKIHAGFYEIYQHIREEVLSIIRENYTESKICVIGHSLGGCIATLLAYDLNDYNAVVYTLGSPHVSNKEFAKYITTPIFRVNNEADDVSKMIVSNVSYNKANIMYTDSYSRIGTLVYFDDNTGNMILNHAIYVYYDNIDKFTIIRPQ